MTPNDVAEYIEGLRRRFVTIEERLADPTIYSNQPELKKISVERRRLSGLFSKFDAWNSSLKELDECRGLAAAEEDEELLAMVNADIEHLEVNSAELETGVRLLLIPPDPNESRNIIVEMRPAAGGEEAALFTSELYRAYTYFIDSSGWKMELLEMNATELGGIKEVLFSVMGDDAFAKLRYESGVHRVQRVPRTESGGRVHTSTITVAVLPEAEEVELDINPEDLRFDVFRASGPGGQSVNTTDSAVRVTHMPSGLSVASQQEKSQHRNKETALRILRARLLERKQQEEAAKQAASKRAQVGTGDRSERIRTYNFPQNRITDHRFGVSVHDLPRLMEGDFGMLLAPILNAAAERRLEELGELK